VQNIVSLIFHVHNAILKFYSPATRVLVNEWFAWIVNWLIRVTKNNSDWIALPLFFLQVVRKSAAQHQDYAPAVPWPRGVKGSPYHSARFLRAPVPTGIAGESTLKPPFKFGARSLQWKRDAQGTSSGSSSISAPVSRGLTYVRAESKLDGSSSTR
jgi:hypothetical protein